MCLRSARRANGQETRHTAALGAATYRPLPDLSMSGCSFRVLRGSLCHERSQTRAGQPKPLVKAPGGENGWPRPERPGPSRGLSLPGSAPTEAKRAWRALGQLVVLPGVRRGLDLGHGLPRCRVEVIQPAGGTDRVGMIQSTRLIGAVQSARWALHLTCERFTG